MFTLAVINQKGGSAKTTTAVNLGASLAEMGRKVLVVDLDPQASASEWLGVRDAGRGLLEGLLRGEDLTPLVQPTDCGLDLIPCGVCLASLDRLTTEEPGAETLLRHALAPLTEGWEVVILDCPPNLNMASRNALVAASVALVPVTAHFLSLEPLARLVQTMKRVRERLNPGFRLSGLVPCRVDHRTHHAPEMVKLLRKKFGSHVYETVVSETIRLAECPAFRKPITSHDPDGRAAAEYRGLAEEFQRREDAGLGPGLPESVALACEVT